MKQKVGRLILIGTLITPGISSAGNLVDETIALLGNSGSLGLYSRQLEIDIAQMKLNVEREHASKIEALRSEARAKVAKNLSEELSRLQEQKLKIEALLAKSEQAVANLRSVRKAGRDLTLEGQSLGSDLTALVEAQKAQQMTLSSIESVLVDTEGESEECLDNLACKAVILAEKLDLEAKRLGISVEQLAVLSAKTSSPEMARSILLTSSIAEESARALRTSLRIKLQAIALQITAKDRSLQEILK